MSVLLVYPTYSDYTHYLHIITRLFFFSQSFENVIFFPLRFNICNQISIYSNHVILNTYVFSLGFTSAYRSLESEAEYNDK